MEFVHAARLEHILAFKQVIELSIRQSCQSSYTREQLDALLNQYPLETVYQRWINDSDRRLTVAEYDGRVVGFAQYFVAFSLIEAMHVLPAYQGRGIGRALLLDLETCAKSHAKNQVRLSASLNAVGFYERCGYTNLGRALFKCNNGVELDVVSFEKRI